MTIRLKHLTTAGLDTAFEIPAQRRVQPEQNAVRLLVEIPIHLKCLLTALKLLPGL